MKQIPVYMFTGFLEGGKTRFMQETLCDKRFNDGERTLVLMCEEGIEELDPSKFPSKYVYIETIDDIEEELTNSSLLGTEIRSKYVADDEGRCIICGKPAKPALIGRSY